MRSLSRFVLLPLFAAALSAAPLLWTLSGVTYSDGGTVTGSFVYDPVTNTFGAINITTTAGSVRSGATYHFLNPSYPANSTANVYVTAGSGDLTGTPGMSLVLGAPMTAAGGTIAVGGGTEGACSNAVCISAAVPLRTIIAGGSVVGGPLPPVPTLSTSGMIVLSAFMTAAGVFLLRRVPSAEA